MGGTGGSYFHSTPDKLLEQLRVSQSETDTRSYDIEVAKFLNDNLVNFNDRNTELIASLLDDIRDALGEQLDGTIDLIFGGSVSKHTYVDGLSDVDALVLLDNCELADGSPDAAKQFLADQLAKLFAKAAVSVGTLAVTIAFDGFELQLLPAVKCGDSLKIRDAAEDNWSLVKPREFAKLLTRTNDACGGKVVPVIKLAKAIISRLPPRQQLSGYHVEAMSVQVFREYRGEINSKAMITHFFSEGSKALLAPIHDHSGQSVHVDDYLGQTNSLERRIVADAFSRISRRMKNADTALRVDDWRRLFDE